MAISTRLTGFKTEEGKKKAIADYETQLAKKIEVDQINAGATSQYYKRAKLNIPAAPVAKKTAAEEIADQSFQRDLAFTTLKKFMKDADASNVLFNYLVTHDDVVEFNRFSTSFIRSIRGQQNITPEYFRQLWNRFKEKLIKTGFTDIPIGIDAKEYEEDVKAIEAGLKLLARPKFKKAHLEAKILGKDVERITQLKKTLIESPPDFIENLFLDKLAEEDPSLTIVTEHDYVDIPSDDGKSMEHFVFGLWEERDGEAKYIEDTLHSRNGYLNMTESKEDADENEHIVYGPEGTISGLLMGKKIQFIIFKVLGFPYGEEIKYTLKRGATKFVRVVNFGEDVEEIEVRAREASAHDSRRTSIGSLEDEERMSQRSATLSERLRAPVFKPPASGTGTKKKKMPKHDRLKPVFYKIGSGFNNTERTCTNKMKRQPNFGAYFISPIALKKGFITLQYPSGGAVPQFRKQMISSVLRTLLSDILYDNNFDENKYDQLEKPEKILFDDLIRFARLDVKENLLLYRHKKYNDDERNKDINRFNILKGELIAGNDNPEIIKELKSLLFKFMESHSISRADYNLIMRKIITIV